MHNVVRKEDSKGFVLLFSREFYSSNQQQLNQFPFLNNNSQEPILNLKPQYFEPLNALVTTILSEQNSDDLMANELIKAYLNTFLIHCKRFFNENKEQVLSSKGSLYYKFRQLIEENYLQIHSVAEYANRLNSSERQLATATKKKSGLTPKALIDERITLEAKRLVRYTSYSLQEIAFFLNYTDASHFAKFFKSKTGDTPGEYREKGKKYS